MQIEKTKLADTSDPKDAEQFVQLHHQLREHIKRAAANGRCPLCDCDLSWSDVFLKKN